MSVEGYSSRVTLVSEVSFHQGIVCCNPNWILAAYLCIGTRAHILLLCALAINAGLRLGVRKAQPTCG